MMGSIQTILKCGIKKIVDLSPDFDVPDYILVRNDDSETFSFDKLLFDTKKDLSQNDQQKSQIVPNELKSLPIDSE